MTLEEYKARLAALEKEYWNKKVELAKACAFSNNPYKIGDILQDGNKIIKVESIEFDYGTFRSPQCAYFGTQLTRKLRPKKKQGIRLAMYQVSVRRKLN